MRRQVGARGWSIIARSLCLASAAFFAASCASRIDVRGRRDGGGPDGKAAVGRGGGDAAPDAPFDDWEDDFDDGYDDGFAAVPPLADDGGGTGGSDDGGLEDDFDDYEDDGL